MDFRSITFIRCIFFAVVIAKVYGGPDSRTGSSPSATVDHLKTNNPAAEKELGELLDGGEDAMVTLIAGDTRLTVHRAVLAARGPVLAAMLEDDNGRIVLPDMEGPVLRQLLGLLYTLDDSEDPSAAPQLWATPDPHGAPVQKAECRQRAASPLTVETAAATAVFAIRKSCSSLTQAAVAFIKAHMPEVIASPGWADAVYNWDKEVEQVTRLLFDAPAETCSPATGGGRTTPTTQPLSHHTDLGQTPSTAAPSVTSCASPPPDSSAISALRSLSAEQKASRLREAAKQGAVGEVAALLSAGAAAGAADEDGWTALHWAASGGHEEVARCLLGAGADVGARDSWGQWTPLHRAAAYGRTGVVRLLLAASADPDARDVNGYSPLHFAALHGHTEAAAALLEAGADRGAKTKYGETALDIARRRNNQQVVALLS